MRRKIEAYSLNTITLENLLEMSVTVDYWEFEREISGLVDEHLLKPMKSSLLNGRQPPLYNKYRIIRAKPDYSAVLENIKLLHPKFDHSKYAAQPEAYVKHKEEIDDLSRFLWEKEALLAEPLSINERSFQIWGVEKLLKDTSIVKSIFRFNEWDLSSLNYYETPEPFFDYNYTVADEMNVLIVENKDTWYSLRKIMQEGGGNRLFRPYHILLYGEGKKILSKHNRLNEYDQLLPTSRNVYYYFGDVDYEGIDIYESLVEGNPDLDVRLANELYTAMLALADGRKLPFSKEGQRQTDISHFLQQFDQEAVEKIRSILGQGLYIPQEILNYSWMKKNMSTEMEV
ncbi:Wadjet anti-phage system protein JetD domain-containing protein [Saccharococcus sp. Marseille-Q5394]|uniref:Wadjet anti-phage system protein JetD domain-containing protein n=1 Tax=Saccharococcus sp. Marseille-Q5394 TaxID=2972778 RepID=UPI0021C6B2FF|nr:Wadjet anti-phage system protein JetD domain-containing protein [Saccharococcus sp. Marseille-Q5394]